MRVLHLTTQGTGGSYEYAALLSTGLAEQGVESHVLCKNSPSAQTRQDFVRSRYSPSRMFPSPLSRGTERGDCYIRRDLRR